MNISGYIKSLGIAGLLAWAAVSHAAVLQVGAGKPHATVQSAVTAASPGDVIEVDAGLYKGQAATNLLIDKDVTIRGVNAGGGDVMARFDCDDTGVFSIGCWVVDVSTTDVILENIEIFNFYTPAAASCIRVNTPGRFTARNLHLHDCDHGLLSSNQGTAQIAIYNSQFHHNGVPGGQEHNVYVGESASLVFINNRTTNSSSIPGTHGGQPLKSRAKVNVVVGNYIGDPATGTSSNQEADFSCGGTLYMAQNYIHQSRLSPNQRMVTFGMEACQTGPQHLTFIGNILVNEASGSSPVGLQVRKQPSSGDFVTLVIADNLYWGPGQLFLAHDGNLTPDLSTNKVMAALAPPIATVDAPGAISHSLTAAGIVLSWNLPPGATGAVVRREGIVIPGSSSSVTDPGPFAPGTLLTYEIRSLQGTAESQPASYQVRTPMVFPATPTPEAFQRGWYEVPNSRYQQAYPQPPDHRTRYLVEAWSGAGYDQVSNSLMLFGGGLPDYGNNEVLKVPFEGTPSILMPASAPQDITGVPNPVEAWPDGRPAVRHSYGGLAYAPERQTLYVYGGQVPRSVPSNGLWALNMSCACAGMTWQRLQYTGATPEATYGSAAVWNPTDGLLWIKTTLHLYSYDPVTNTMAKRNTSNMNVGIYLSAEIDLARQVLVLMTPTAIYEVQLASPATMAIVHAFAPDDLWPAYPGMAYDRDLQRVVMWAGGSRFGVITGNGYTTRQVIGGPGAQVPTGTHDRFVYIPKWRVFGLQNFAAQHLWVAKID